jgi:hypothetical protein
MMPSRLPKIYNILKFAGCIALVLAAILPPRQAHAILTNGENAIDILGQFTSPSSDATPDYAKGCVNNGASPIGFDSPEGSAIDSVNHRLFVSEWSNNRVLVFNCVFSFVCVSGVASEVPSAISKRRFASFVKRHAPNIQASRACRLTASSRT